MQCEICVTLIMQNTVDVRPTGNVEKFKALKAN